MTKIYRNFTAYFIFVVPALLLYLTFYLTPLFNSLHYSFTSWNGINDPVYVGFDNFTKALSDDKFWVAFKNNIYFVAFSIFIQVPLIIFVAIMVSGVKRFLGFYKLTVFMPSILSTASVAIIWKFIFAPEAGLLNQVLRAAGLDSWTHIWLGDQTLAIFAVLVTNGWQWTGFYIVLVLAAIFAIPKEILEAGEIDGAVGWKKARLLTIPLIRPVIGVTLLLSVTGAMKALDIVLIMTKGGPFGSTELMATYMYKQAYSLSDFGYANAIAIVITLFTALISLILHFFNGRTKEESY
ncbi:sugar ABC transporter permease [Paenibacillus pectinilyticus]|uniref:Sugar ABC transporter permease n=1 Tax=Paenibacillus pectinilyticus TaxID=512399 RepID=A0A1C1A6X6_9BACL|nr:sugar ABC transporter permease [Paenibacillus pectinilyticus]OCT16315.1 sugar ABC transporter permease [Paenibacillus pectinilyticus]